MIRMLFSADSVYGILSAEIGIVGAQMMGVLIIIVQVFTTKRNTSALPMVEALFIGAV